MGTFLLLLFIIFFVVPMVRIAYTVYKVRSKMRDAMKGMYGAQQPDAGSDTRRARKGGWSAPGEHRKKIGKDVGEYVKFEELPSSPASDTSQTPRHTAYEPQITDADWEDIK